MEIDRGKVLMEIDREKVLEILKVQMGRDDSERGMQPEMILSCFYGKGVNDDCICRECGHYAGCYPTLKIGIIERKPFERS
jgi:hypothetical protein